MGATGRFREALRRLAPPAWTTPSPARSRWLAGRAASAGSSSRPEGGSPGGAPGALGSPPHATQPLFAVGRQPAPATQPPGRAVVGALPGWTRSPGWKGLPQSRRGGAVSQPAGGCAGLNGEGWLGDSGS